MSMQELLAPETEAEVSVVTYRQLIVEKVCFTQGKSRAHLRRTSSEDKFEHPWLDICETISYLLKRDTGATFEEIAETMPCTVADAERLVKKINERLTKNAREDSFFRVRIKLAADEAMRAFENNEMPKQDEPVDHPIRKLWFARQRKPWTAPPKKQMPVLELQTIVDSIVKMTEAKGFSAKDILGGDTQAEVVLLRDVLVVLSMAFTDVPLCKVSEIVHRGSSGLALSLERFLKRKAAYLPILEHACQELQVDMKLLEGWVGRRPKLPLK